MFDSFFWMEGDGICDEMIFGGCVVYLLELFIF